MFHYFYPLRLYSIFIIAIGCIVGIWWQSQAYPFWITGIAIIIAFTFLMTINRYWKLNKTMIIILTFLLFILGCIRYQHIINRHKTFQEATRGKTYSIMGVITNYLETGNRQSPHRFTIMLNQLSNDQEEIYIPAHQSLFIYSKSFPCIEIGNAITIHGVQFKHNYSDDFNIYLLKEGVSGTIFLQKHKIIRHNNCAFSLRRWIFNCRKALTERCKKDMHPKTYKYFSAIFLGNPAIKKIINPIKIHLQQWGIIHYLARSGLHLVIFIMLWQLLFRIIPLGFAIKELILLLLCCLYAILSWPSIPFYRALITYILIRSCTLARLRVYFLPMLSLITIATILINPIYLFALDFQLSFGLTGALAWFNEIQVVRRS